MIMTIVLILFLLVMVETFVLMYIFSKGGKYIKTILKENMPGYKGRGRFVLFLDKSFTFFLDYVMVGDDNKIIMNGDPYIAEGKGHSFVNYSQIDFSKSTIHRFNRKPLYFLAEGSPTDILVSHRDYDNDIYKLHQIIQKLEKAYTSNNTDLIRKANSKVYDLLLKLNNSFKYLPAAQDSVSLLLSEGSPNDHYGADDSLKLLDKYIISLKVLSNILHKKTHTMVNFKEFFTTGNLTKIFNGWFKSAQQFERLAMANESEATPPLQKWGSVILIILILLVGFIVYNQGKTLTSMQSSISSINTNITKLNPDTNSLFAGMTKTERAKLLTQLQNSSGVVVDVNGGQ